MARKKNDSEDEMYLNIERLVIDEESTSDMTGSWRQHPDETNEAYEFFYRYFLPLSPTRQTVLEAYKELCIQSKGWTRERADGLTTVPIDFLRYAEGRDREGAMIQGLPPFSLRAQQYNREMQDDDLERKMERRRQIEAREKTAAERMFEDWNRIYDETTMYFEQKRIQAAAGDEEFNPLVQLQAMKELWRTMTDVISPFNRNNAGMVARVTEDIVEKRYLDERDNTIEVVYEDPTAPEFRHAEDFWTADDLYDHIAQDADTKRYLDEMYAERSEDDDDADD